MVNMQTSPCPPAYCKNLAFNIISWLADRLQSGGENLLQGGVCVWGRNWGAIQLPPAPPFALPTSRGSSDCKRQSGEDDEAAMPRLFFERRVSSAQGERVVWVCVRACALVLICRLLMSVTAAITQSGFSRLLIQYEREGMRTKECKTKTAELGPFSRSKFSYCSVCLEAPPSLD